MKHNMHSGPRAIGLAAGLVICVALAASNASAQSVQSFYQGKTIKFITGGSPGGGYDLYIRTLGEHMGRHIPGQPNIVVENLRGAGGRKAMNFVYKAAVKDGTNVVMAYNVHPIYQLLQPKGVRFDVRKLNWLGNMAKLNSVVSVMRSTGVTSVEDAQQKKVIMGASSKSSQTYFVPRMFNALVKTKFDIVLGYRGTSPMFLAMERGEIEGRVGSWYIIKAAKPDWLRENKLVILAQDGLARNPELPDVRLYQELVKDPVEKQMMTFMSYPVETSRAVAVAPGVPADRVAALRNAFVATLKDPAFLKVAEKRKMDIHPGSHQQVEAAIAEVFKTPPRIVKAVRDTLGWK